MCALGSSVGGGVIAYAEAVLVLVFMFGMSDSVGEGSDV